MLKIRSFTTYFVFNEEDWRALAARLEERFPHAIYFLSEYKQPVLKSFGNAPDSWPLSYFESLQVLLGSQPSKECSFYMRDPWPEDLASGKPLDLIGGWETGRMIGTAEGYHRHGRCAEFGRNGIGVGRWRLASCPDYSGGLAVERLGTLPVREYGDVECYYDPFFSSLYARYNVHEPALKTFADDVRRIVQQLGTQSVALYHPVTGEILDPKYRTKKATIGWNILKQGYSRNPIFLTMPLAESGGDSHPRRQGVVGLIGPRPDHPVVRKWRRE